MSWTSQPPVLALAKPKKESSERGTVKSRRVRSSVTSGLSPAKAATASPASTKWERNANASGTPIAARSARTRGSSKRRMRSARSGPCGAMLPLITQE